MLLYFWLALYPQSFCRNSKQTRKGNTKISLTSSTDPYDWNCWDFSLYYRDVLPWVFRCVYATS